MRKTIFKNGLAALILLFSSVLNLYAQDCMKIREKERDVRKISKQGRDKFRRYDTANLTDGYKAFYNNFKYKDSRSDEPPSMLDSCIEHVNIDDICMLFKDVEPNDTLYHPETDLAAIRITYGMEGKRLVMIYEPIVLKVKKQISKRRYVYQFDSSTSTNKFYRLSDNGRLEQFDNARDMAALVNVFRDSINGPLYFERRNIEDSHRFRFNFDVRSTIFLMQDIESEIKQNPKPEQASPKITFSFVSNNFGGFLRPKLPKIHIVALYNIGKNEKVEGQRFASYGADYSQMCPPQCSLVELEFSE